MDEKKKDLLDQDLPHSDHGKPDQRAARNREQLDSIPEPGTDPLHEGP